MKSFPERSRAHLASAAPSRAMLGLPRRDRPRNVASGARGGAGGRWSKSRGVWWRSQEGGLHALGVRHLSELEHADSAQLGEWR